MRAGFGRGTAAVYLLAIFITGLGSGWVLGRHATRQLAVAPAGSREIAKSLEHVFKARLNLSTDQEAAADGIVERSARELERLQNQYLAEIQRRVDDRNTQLRTLFTWEQQVEFDRFDRIRCARQRAADSEITDPPRICRATNHSGSRRSRLIRDGGKADR